MYVYNIYIHTTIIDYYTYIYIYTSLHIMSTPYNPFPLTMRKAVTRLQDLTGRVALITGVAGRMRTFRNLQCGKVDRSKYL